MGKYKIIYADPAWPFNDKRTGGSLASGAADHYTTTSVTEMAALPIANLADDDAVLVMWWVASQPYEALALAQAWGFTVKTMTGFVWNKLTVKGNPFFGMGRYTRAGAECALIATRGRPVMASRSVRSVRSAPVGRHSEKPAAFRDDIVELCGDVPRIELFARTHSDGWDVWGNQVANGVAL